MPMKTPEQYGFKQRKFRGKDGYMLKIDDNFKIFAWTPYVSCNTALAWDLLKGPSSKKTASGCVFYKPGDDAFKSILHQAGEYLSNTGTMHTYASITLRTTTGVN